MTRLALMPVDGSARRHLDTYLGDCRELVVAEIRRLFDHRDDHREALYDLILDYPLREGKALRPALSIALCRGLGGSLDAILPTAATLELYHNAFLIHDDIEDESLIRRGRPTLHVDKGVPVAVNVGDAMLCLSLQPLLDNIERIGLGPALKILQAVATMTRESVEGQALELEWVEANRWDLADEHYLQMVVQKTGWYSFITPMQVGAIAAGADRDAVDQLVDLGASMGTAFQITDDVLNLRADPEEYGKEIGGDLWEGKRTLILLHALRRADRADRERAIDILGRARPSIDGGPDRGHLPASLLDRLEGDGQLTPAGRATIESAMAPTKTMDDIRFLAELIDHHGSLAHASRIAAEHATEAAALLNELTWLPDSSHRQTLADLIDFVHGRTR